MTSSIRIPRDIDGDDDYYMDKMKEILEGFPNGVPAQHPGKLSDHIFIGNQDNAEDYDLLPALGITHVLNCAGTRTFDLTKSRYPPKLGITGFLMLPAEDFDEFDIMQFFSDAIAFLDKAKASGGKALVHCNLGVNRSGAICAAYLMVSQRKPLLKVITEMKAKRPVVLCNVGFRRQLLKYARARGLLDTVEEGKPAEKKDRESVKVSEYRYKYSSTNGYDSKNKDEDLTTRSDEINGNGDESSRRNAWNDDTINSLLSTEAYKSSNSKSYLSSSGNKDSDWSLDDDLDELDSNKFPSHTRKPSPSVSRLPVTSQYTLTNGHDSLDSARLSSLSSVPVTSYSSCNVTDRSGPSTYNSYSSVSRGSESYVPTVPITTRIRDITPTRSTYSSLTSDAQRLSASRLLDVDDNKTVDTPFTDNYEASRRSSDRKSWSIPLDLTGTADRYLDSFDYKNINTDVDNVADARSSYNKYMETSSLSNGISPLLFVDTSPTTHPLLVKPTKITTCAADSFKTTVKPKSYYHRKVIGRVPKYSDLDDTFLNDLNSHNSDLDYKSARSSYLPDCDYGIPSRISNASGKLILNDVVYQPRSFIDNDYSIESLSSAPRRSFHLSTGISYDSYGSSVGRDHLRSSSVGRLGTSYRPSYKSRSGYINDLDDDIEAFNQATSSIPTENNFSRNIRSRVPPPSYTSSSYRSVPLYAW